VEPSLSPNPRRHDKDQDNIPSMQPVPVIANPNVTEDKVVDIRDPTY